MRYPDPLPDYYAALGVDRDASDREIVVAYRREVRLCHPDLHPEGDPDEARIREVNQAYEVLGDPARRADYDREVARRERLASAGRAGWTPFGYGPRPEWVVRRGFAGPSRQQPSPLADLLAALEMLLDLDDLEWERAFILEVERSFGVDLRRIRRRFGGFW